MGGREHHWQREQQAGRDPCRPWPPQGEHCHSGGTSQDSSFKSAPVSFCSSPGLIVKHSPLLRKVFLSLLVEIHQILTPGGHPLSHRLTFKPAEPRAAYIPFPGSSDSHSLGLRGAPCSQRQVLFCPSSPPEEVPRVASFAFLPQPEPQP